MMKQISSFFTKEIDKITYSDIETLVDGEIAESSVLDYKSKMISKDKLGRIMVAFANGSGGYVVMGIEEKKNKDGKNTGKPDQIVGVKPADYTNLITNIAMGQTHPQIVPQINHNISLPKDPNRLIVVIKIRESLKPIMWKNKWPIRINDQTVYADNSLMKKLFNKENYKLETRVQRIFDNIRRNLERIKIESDSPTSDKKRDYRFILRKSVDHQATDNAMLMQFQREFTNYVKSFQEEWKYFGIREDNGDLSFCFGRYGLFSRLFRVSNYMNIGRGELINKMIGDMKKLSKDYYQIDLD